MCDTDYGFGNRVAFDVISVVVCITSEVKLGQELTLSKADVSISLRQRIYSCGYAIEQDYIR